MAGSSDIRAGRAFVELYVKNSALMKGLNDAQKRLKDFGNGVSMVGKWMMGLGTAALAPIAAMVGRFESAGSALNDMSQRTGMSVESLSSLSYAAGQTSATIEDVEAAARKMQKAIGAAAAGEKAGVDALKQLGLSYSGIKSMSPDKQFDLIAKRVAAIKNPTSRAAAAMEIFGKSGTKILPMISDMEALRKKANDLGVVMSTKDAAAADSLGDSIGDLKSVIMAAGNAIIAKFAPILESAIQTIMGVVQSTKKWIDANSELVLSLTALAAKTALAGAGIYGVGKAISFAGSAFGEIRATMSFVISNGIALTAGMALMAVGIGAVAAAFANAQIKGITFGESVLDLTNKITGLDNAYSRLQGNLGSGQTIGAPSSAFDAASKSGDTGGTSVALKQMRANRDRLASDVANARPGLQANRTVLEWTFGWNNASAEADLKLKEADLKQAELLLARYEKQQLAVSASSAIKAPFSAMLKGTEFALAGAASGISYAKGFLGPVRAAIQSSSRASGELERVRAEGIADPKKRDEKLANIEYDSKASEARASSGGFLTVVAIEAARQQELANIRARYAAEAAKKASEDAEKRGQREREIAYETEQARIEATATGHAKEMALLALRQKKEREDASAEGIDPGILAAKQQFEASALGMKDVQTTTASTFAASALQGMGGSGSAQERTARAGERALKWFGEQTTILRDIKDAQKSTVLAMAE